jgi:hypothetical protein
MAKHDLDSPNADGDTNLNTSGNTSLETLINANLSRRNVLRGGLGIATTAFVGGGLAGCFDFGSGDNGGTGGNDGDGTDTTALEFNFTPVAKSVADALVIPPEYSYAVLYAGGQRINNDVAEFKNDGTDDAASWALRAGDHHDGMAYFGLNDGGNNRDASGVRRGLLAMNHENINRQFLHAAGEVAVLTLTDRPTAQIDKEVHAHGVSVIAVRKAGNSYVLDLDSSYNRRVTAATPIDIYGPARGNALMQTKYSPDGSKTLGTLNNCSNGFTPWGTYLTCEENWAGYFKRPASSTLDTKAATAQNRYMGSGASEGTYGWANPLGGDASPDSLYDRWNVTPGGSATTDFRNGANNMGWIVEIDPYGGSESVPRKRTALGRFGHEGSMPGLVRNGKPIVFYLGDDSTGEYIYKYVSSKNWQTGDANAADRQAIGNKYMDDGKLYVAKFNADGSGEWLLLDIGNPAISGYAGYAFASQADVLINARLAADAVGATPMDRPEWADVNPVNGDVYVTLTNNTGNRGKAGGKPLDAANPRFYSDTRNARAPFVSAGTSTGNVNGHIVRMQENSGDSSALMFQWDIYLFGAQADADPANVNVSGLTPENDFSSPDGLWFSRKTPGLMWLQTDDGAYTDTTNCMMLAALPGAHGDGEAPTTPISSTGVQLGDANQTITTYVGAKASPDKLARFLVGPAGCEITGITETPDGKAIFVNIQHPGENTSANDVRDGNSSGFQSHWPEGGSARPRSATVVITRRDGGPVGVGQD